MRQAMRMVIQFNGGEDTQRPGMADHEIKVLLCNPPTWCFVPAVVRTSHHVRQPHFGEQEPSVSHYFAEFMKEFPFVPGQEKLSGTIA
jgi:hypothetical protein